MITIMQKTDILSMYYEEINEYLREQKHPAYRTGQIFEWLHQKRSLDIDDFSNLSKQLRDELKENFYIFPLKIQKKLVSEVDNTVKYVYELKDKEVIETVLMEYKYGKSICISTQAGCRMGCVFCASAGVGFSRNLTVSEMLGQIYSIERELGENISNIVLMGIGEPLDNYDNVIKFVKVITDYRGRDFAGRKITISTCGIADKIDALAELKLPLQLSVSLHAPDDTLRRSIMPIAKAFPLNRLMDSVKNYADITNKRITFEYALISGVNDSDNHARALVGLLKQVHCHLNLISVNTVIGGKLLPSVKIDSFKNIIESSGINVTVRRTLGSDINAACGQLRKQILTQ